MYNGKKKNQTYVMFDFYSIYLNKKRFFSNTTQILECVTNRELLIYDVP